MKKEDKNMNKFIISVESACDIDRQTILDNNIQVAPMQFIVNGTTISTDDKNFSANKIAQLLREGVETKTTQINEYDAKNYLTDILKLNKDIIHISFSSGMSNTFNNFNNVAGELNKSNVNKIVVVDSLCQSGGVGLLVKMLLDAVNDGRIKNIYEAKDYLDAVKLKVCHFFTVDNLKYLARGGRISATSAFVGNMLQLKPVLRLDNNGMIVPFKKVMGRKKAIKELVELMKTNYNGLNRNVMITEADCLEDAELLKQKVLDEFDVDVTVVSLSPLVTCHSGPGTLALYFTLDER